MKSLTKITSIVVMLIIHSPLFPLGAQNTGPGMEQLGKSLLNQDSTHAIENSTTAQPDPQPADSERVYREAKIRLQDLVAEMRGRGYTSENRPGLKEDIITSLKTILEKEAAQLSRPTPQDVPKSVPGKAPTVQPQSTVPPERPVDSISTPQRSASKRPGSLVKTSPVKVTPEPVPADFSAVIETLNHIDKFLNNIAKNPSDIDGDMREIAGNEEKGFLNQQEKYGFELAQRSLRESIRALREIEKNRAAIAAARQ